MLMFVMVTWPSVQTMLAGVEDNLPSLWALVQGLSFVAGMAFSLRGIYKLKEYGELRTMMSSQTSLMRPMVMFIVAAGLLYLPGIYQISLYTLFQQTHASPLSWSTKDYTSWRGIITVIIDIVQFVGIVAFVRGWFMMSHLSGQSAQQGTFGKAMTHIIGGILAVNIVGTAKVLESTFKISVF